ncbi:RnfH family protein [Thiocapsa imhoffii]|uniref:UPF0125 protein CKO25_01340 n=1 Tax=Thiocapsa imhoffii TaxID=382777 RepID=A0A9X0WEX4_9GAMM|nr:RnfH family protein [Thiocapsa imhoffii]MBK1643318.1 RnfH family protein [Thiocapsa imhoffii]
MATDYLQVTLVHVGREAQFQRSFEVQQGSHISEVIAQSGVLDVCPEIDLSVNQVGIFGKVAKLEQVVADGDRVEIYRPLIADPKQARKKRAAEGRPPRKGASEAASADG